MEALMNEDRRPVMLSGPVYDRIMWIKAERAERLGRMVTVSEVMELMLDVFDAVEVTS
jgi:hypothetical protein